MRCLLFRHWLVLLFLFLSILLVSSANAQGELPKVPPVKPPVVTPPSIKPPSNPVKNEVIIASGQINDFDGKPISEAEVTIEVKTDNQERKFKAITNRNGEYKLTEPSKNDGYKEKAKVTPQKDGYLFFPTQTTKKPIAFTYDFKGILERSLLSGQIINFNGQPLPDVEVTIEGTKDKKSFWRKITTNEKGHYNFSALSKEDIDNVYKGSISLVPRKDGYRFFSISEGTNPSARVFMFRGIPRCDKQRGPDKITELLLTQSTYDHQIIEPLSCGCQPNDKDGLYYNAYKLNVRDKYESFTLKIEPTPPNTVSFQILDKDGKTISKAMNYGKVIFSLDNGSDGSLPFEGEYTIRIGVSDITLLPYEYDLKLIYNGIAAEGYKERLKTVLELKSYDQVETAQIDKTLVELLNRPRDWINQAIKQLELLTTVKIDCKNEDDLNKLRKELFELLGTLCAHSVPIMAKEAEDAFKEAIKLGGEARMIVSYSQDKLPQLNKSGAIIFEGAAKVWLKIKNKGLVLKNIPKEDSYPYACGTCPGVSVNLKLIKGKASAYYLEIRTEPGGGLSIIPGTSPFPENVLIVNLAKRLFDNYALHKN